MDEHPMIKTTKAFLTAIEAVETDECINLNLGYHDQKITETFNALVKEAHLMPILSAILLQDRNGNCQRCGDELSDHEYKHGEEVCFPCLKHEDE